MYGFKSKYRKSYIVLLAATYWAKYGLQANKLQNAVNIYIKYLYLTKF